MRQAVRVRDEILGGLEPWEAKGRWDGLLGAGTRDTAPPTIFDKIVSREIPSEIVWEDELCLALYEKYGEDPRDFKSEDLEVQVIDDDCYS